MKIALILAMGKHREIGKKGGLPWKLPREMQFFKETTMGNIVVMGRKSWEALPNKFRPLPGRENIVITRNPHFKEEGATIIHELEQLHTLFDKNEERVCYIIGGAQIVELALAKEMVDEMIITHVQATFDADTYFPFVNWENWGEEDVLSYEKDEKNPHSFIIKKYTKL